MVAPPACPESIVLDSKKTIQKSSGKQSSTFNERGNHSTIYKSKPDESQSAKANDEEVLTFRVSKKSLRARPDNPVRYKVLREAKIRFGKSVRSDFVKIISKGSVVVINQIKGRSGRVVVPHPHGSFTKVGWVTLYTHDRQKLLEKLSNFRRV
jgi:hypothetical protein